MRLFLPRQLEGFDLCKGEEQTGEARGGKYAARVQTGVEKDGSPKYRYFDSVEEYKAYLEGSGKKKERQGKQKKDSSDLSTKVSKEQKESKKKQESSESHKEGEKESSKDGLLAGKKSKRSDEETKKSLHLYLGVK